MQHPQQNAVGDDADSRVAAHSLIEAHGISDFAADFGPALKRDAAGGSPCGDAARFEHDDRPLPGQPRIQNRRRDARRLSRTRSAAAPDHGGSISRPRTSINCRRTASIGSGARGTEVTGGWRMEDRR